MNTYKMQAGRVFDELIATKVMGWKRVDNPQKYYDYEGFYQGETVWVDDEGDPALLPRYSTDIEDAWKVVEKLDEDYFVSIHVAGKIISINAIDDKKTIKAKKLGLRGNAVRSVAIESAETIPLAICKAALKLVGGGSDEHI